MLSKGYSSSLGQQKWIPGPDNMVPPYFEGAESILGLVLPQFRPFRGFLGLKPENMAENMTPKWVKIRAGQLRIGQKSLGIRDARAGKKGGECQFAPCWHLMIFPYRYVTTPLSP